MTTSLKVVGTIDEEMWEILTNGFNKKENMEDYEMNKLDYEIQKLSGINKDIQEATTSSDYEINESEQVIKYFVPSFDKSEYITKEAFNNVMNKFMKRKLNETKPKNEVLSISCDACLRCVKYIDIDHYKKETIDEAINKVLSVIRSIMKDQLYYVLVFKPATEPIDGAHIYLIYNVELTTEQDEEFINKFENELGESFDKLPWKSPVMNLPFCHKSFEKRDYLLQLNQSIPNNKEELENMIDSVEFISESKTYEEMNEFNDFAYDEGVELDKNYIQLIIDSFNAFNKIHRTQNASFAVKVALLPIIQFINGIKNNELLISSLRTCEKLTDNARKSFNSLLVECRSISGVNAYISLVKAQAKKYYSAHEREFKDLIEEVKKLKMKNNEVDDSIFEYVALKEVKAAETIEKKQKLLLKCMFNMFHLNCFFSLLDSPDVEIIKYDELNNKLITCGIQNSKDRERVRMNLMAKARSDKEISFNSLFNGWKYQLTKSNEYDKNTKDFKDCVLLNICSNEVDIYNYLMKRISYVLHHPGARSNVCVILQGLQGTGKNWFEDIICELFCYYSSMNTELNKLNARFNGSVVIGKNWVVCNEALNADGMFSIKEGMKKLIERPKMNIEKKGIDPFDVDNCLNIDITTNNIKPVLIDPEDRRYLIIRTNGEHANDKTYWKYYQEEVIKREGFYNDIFTMIYEDFNNDDFLSLPIPQTEARKTLMRLCLNPIHKYIMKNIDRLEVGMSKTEIRNDYKMMNNEDKGNYSAQRFIEEVINYCRMKTLHNKNYYYINENIADVFASLIEEDDEEQEQEQEQETNNEEVEEWINEHKQTFNDKFEYILSSDVKEREIREYLISNGWVYKSSINRKQINKRGYVKLL